MKTTTISLARERGENSGIQDAYRHDTGPNFEPTENPYGLESESDLHEAWEKGYENTFEERKRKP